jgi:hypothetical protein
LKRTDNTCLDGLFGSIIKYNNLNDIKVKVKMEDAHTIIDSIRSKRKVMQPYVIELEHLRSLPYEEVASVLTAIMNKGKYDKTFGFDMLMEINFRKSMERMQHLLPKPGWHYLLAEAIYEYGDAVDTAALIYIATHSRYSSARFLAVQGLKAFGTHDALPALHQIRATDRGTNADGDRVSDLAAEAIAAIEARAHLPASPDSFGA